MHGDGPFVVRMAAWADEWIPTDDIKMVNWHWIASIGTIALTSILLEITGYLLVPLFIHIFIESYTSSCSHN